MRTLLMISAFVFLSGSSFGQRVDSLAFTKQRMQFDSLKKNRPEFYRRALGLDSVEANRVSEIQDTYKRALYLVVQDSTLTLEACEERIGILMTERNRKLRGQLSPERQRKVIPSTELKVDSLQSELLSPFSQ